MGVEVRRPFAAGTSNSCRDRAQAAAALVAHQQARLVGAGRQLEVAAHRDAALEHLRPVLLRHVQLQQLLLLVDLPAVARVHDHVGVECGRDLAVLRTQAQAADLHLRHQQHRGLLGGRAQHVAHEPERDAVRGHGRVESRADLGGQLVRVGLALLAVLGRVVAAARAHLDVRLRHLDRELAVAAVALDVAGVEADQVIRARLVGDPRHLLRQAAGAGHDRPARVERDRTCAFDRLLRQRQDGGGVPLLHVAAELGAAAGHPRLAQRSLRAPGVEVVDRRVRPPRRAHDLAELGLRAVHDEALGHHQQVLAAADGRQRVRDAREGVERQPQPGDGGAVDLTRCGADLGQARRDVQRPRIVLGRVGLRDEVVLVPAAGHVREHLRVAAHPDGHGLVIPDARGRLVRPVEALLAAHVREQAVAVLRQAAGPPRAPRGGRDHHLVAVAQALAYELGHGAARAIGRVLRDVRVVPDDHEGPLHRRTREGVAGDARARRRGRRLRHGHRLERADRLRAPVLLDREVLALQALDGLALLVEHEHVHRHLLDVGREHDVGRRLRGLGLGGRGRNGQQEGEAPAHERRSGHDHVRTSFRWALAGELQAVWMTRSTRMAWMEIWAATLPATERSAAAAGESG